MTAGWPGGWSAFGILVISGFLLACGASTRPAYPSVERAPDGQVLLVTSDQSVTPSRLTFRHLPAESTTAPGLSFRPDRFELVQASPDGRYAAFSTAGHHSFVGLLNIATMAVREIDIVTEGEVVAFHWAADSRILAYDYLPASGYRRVKAYDVQSSEQLVVPRREGRSTRHMIFDRWGPQPHEIVLRLTDNQSNSQQTETVTLTPPK